MNTAQGPTSLSVQSSANLSNYIGASSNTASPKNSRPNGGRSQKRNPEAAGLESSPGSVEDANEGGNSDDRKRQPGVKRACNECRQQKLRCDVVQEPIYKACGRCRRLNLECRIDSAFRRIGKRTKNAEMEREIVELRKKLTSQNSSPVMQQAPFLNPSINTSVSPTMPLMTASLDHYMGSQEAVASLLDLRSGLDGSSYIRSPNGQIPASRRIEDVTLLRDRIDELFEQFFTCFHPFFPLLEPEKSPDQYYEVSPLLFWTIIVVSVRRYRPDPTLVASLCGPVSNLLWATLSSVPQSYIVVKALCIICTWSLPINSSSSDPTLMLSGVMMQIALQIGLHRPSHAQDFTKYKVELREEEMKDRVKTWAACNVVAQRVATGYGQPPSTLYDWTLGPSGPKEPRFRLSTDLEARLLIEKFCNKVTKALYSNNSDSVGLIDDAERPALTTFLARDYEELKETLKPTISSINTLYLRAAGLHLRLSAFFESPTATDYLVDLLALWIATTSFLEYAFNLKSSIDDVLTYATNYIVQMIIASGFTLLKLLNSFFVSHIDLAYGKNLFNKTIRAIRSGSVTRNDLPSRLAEVLVQMWRGGGAGSRMPSQAHVMDGSLQLKVRCRMSMSLVYDSVWRWREEFQAQGRGNLESVLRHPTNPASNPESSASSVADSGLPSLEMVGGPVPQGSSNMFGEPNYEVFDPLNWVLDGVVDFPYISEPVLDSPILI